MTQRGWIVLAALLWALLSWRWYTCHIKGFCGGDAQYKVEHHQDRFMYDGRHQGEALDLDHDGDIDVIVRSLDAGDDELIRGKRCVPYLIGYLLPVPEDEGNSIEDAKKLEVFLNTYDGIDLPLDGIYGINDMNAVKIFQSAYAEDILAPWGIVEPTGRVMQTTRAHINRLHCMQQ